MELMEFKLRLLTNKNKNSNDMEDKIFKILRDNKVGHHKAHYIKNELLILFDVSNNEVALIDFYNWLTEGHDKENAKDMVDDYEKDKAIYDC